MIEQEETVEFPDDLRYTKEHEWARAEGGRVRVGITDFAQDALGDVVYVDLPEVGATVEAASPARRSGVDEVGLRRLQPGHGHRSSERNPLVDDRPELVNEQPYGDGWLIVIDAGGRSVRGRPDGRRGVPFVRRADRQLNPRPSRAAVEGEGAPRSSVVTTHPLTLRIAYDSFQSA